MSYISLKFALFVCIVTALYFLFPAKKYQWTVLLAGSYGFYLFAGVRPVFFLLFTTASTYLTALWIHAIAQKGKEIAKAHKTDWDKQQKKAHKQRIKRRKLAVATASAVANLGILFFLKYHNFLAESINQLLRAWDGGVTFPTFSLFLPLGISFYTFQSVGYVIDVYREKVSAERNFFKVALFVSFFPQIIQGPISFYSQLASQLYEPHRFSFTRAKHGGLLILWGLFKKLVIADRAILTISPVLESYTEYTGTSLLFVLLLYALQLYTDFSGGIDISRGVSQILGIDLAENFRRPYFATTINDYWRRWHISLGAWMKEYIFYPLALSPTFTGASKKIRSTHFGSTVFGAHTAKVLPTCVASVVVFLLVGIWHGANWKYVAFGLWNGGVILLSTLLEPTFQAVTSKLRIPTHALWYRIFQIGRTFLIVLVGYVFDIAPNFTGAMDMMRRMVTDHRFSQFYKEIRDLPPRRGDYLLLMACTLLLCEVSLYQERHSQTTVREILDQKPFLLRYLVILLGVLAVLILGIYGPGYQASDFVYMQF